MSAPANDQLQLDVSELLTAQATISGQQIATLIRRVAELEAANLALRRLIDTGSTNGAAHPKAVSGD